MVRKITFRVILFIGSSIRNSWPCGHFAHSRSVSSTMTFFVDFEAVAVKGRREQPAPISMRAVVKSEYRTGPEPIAEIGLHVAHLFGARGTHRPHQSRVGNDDRSTKEWHVDLEDTAVPLDPTPHRLTPKEGEPDTLDELG